MFRIMSESDLKQEAQNALKEAVDPEDLICYEGATLTRSKLKKCSNDELTDLIENVHAFCCSFVSGSSLNMEKSLSQRSDVEMEESAFAMSEPASQDVEMQSQETSQKAPVD